MVTVATSGNLIVETGAVISTGGTVVSIGNQSAGTRGANLAVPAGGNLTLEPGATLNVSGVGTAAGGTLSLTAGGPASVGATLNGSGGTGAIGGSFLLDAGSLTAASGAGANPLNSLATSLGIGGFTDAIDLRVRTGDFNLGNSSTLSANSVMLTADTGQIVVGGTITADSAALRGRVSLFGGTGVELTAGGALRADGTGSSGLGGKIEIGTGELVVDQTGSLDAYNGGTIRLDAGSTISTAGAPRLGTLLLRAPALVGTNHVGLPAPPSPTSAVG